MNFLKISLCLALLCVSAQATQPNIIFILLDDLGKEWISCYGAEGIETPHVDKLAAQGMRFENAYSMPQCTPSRICFLTGQYPWRNGWVNHWDAPRWGEAYFDWNSNPSIARSLQKAGYATAAAGKWQVNDFRVQPEAMTKHGFDDWSMWTGAEGSSDKKHTQKSSNRYWDPYIHTPEGSQSYPGKFGPDLYNQLVLDFITSHQEQPFFIYYAMALPHSPSTSTPHEPNVKGREECFPAMVRYADYLTGKVVQHLDTLGLSENTLIIWTTDNGSASKLSNHLNGRLVKGGKTKTTENGVNAPFIARWPGKVPAGIKSQALVDFSDMLPTFLDLAQAEPEAGYEYDGVSLKAVLLGETNKSERTAILAMGSRPAMMTQQGIQSTHIYRDRVLRDQQFKLYIGADRQVEKLIDLKNDPEENNDLSQNPEYAAVLERLLKEIENFPNKDGDPNYERILETQKWWKKASKKARKIPTE